MRHNRDPHRREAAHDLHDLPAALEFDTLHAALLHEAHRIRHRGVRRRVVRAERHVREEERVRRAPRDGLCVVDHLVEGELRRRGVPEADLRERVADERDVGQQRGRARERGGIVVCRHHRNRVSQPAAGRVVPGSSLFCAERLGSHRRLLGERSSIGEAGWCSGLRTVEERIASPSWMFVKRSVID